MLKDFRIAARFAKLHSVPDVLHSSHEGELLSDPTYIAQLSIYAQTPRGGLLVWCGLLTIIVLHVHHQQFDKGGRFLTQVWPALAFD